jgi:hypothetical protein
MENFEVEEILKCKANPYYFATKYMVINGKPFSTSLSEKDFNQMMSDIENHRLWIIRGRSKSRGFLSWLKLF